MINKTSEAFEELEKSVYAALETYSNVHRGSGHNSMATTRLYEHARSIVLEHLGLHKKRYLIIFCSPRRAEKIISQIRHRRYQCITGKDTGLPLGVTAIALRRNTLPRGIPFQTGGGTTRLVSRDWAIWARAPEKFEAGTPAIINIIAFARALQLAGHFGKDAFRNNDTRELNIPDILYQDELENYTGSQLLDQIRKTYIGRGNNIPTKEGIKPVIYLDNAASTPTFTPVLKAFLKVLQQPVKSRQQIINEVKSICADFLGAPQSSYDVIFTSNTTEAINLAAENLALESEQDAEPVVLNTILEHNSNDLPWRYLDGFQLIRQDVDSDGFIDPDKLDNTLCDYNRKGLYGMKRIRLVAICGASNVLGVFNNLPEISRIVHKYRAHLLVDAAQLVAHRKIDMESCGIDYLAFSAHKIYAPFGSGALITRKGLLKFAPAEIEIIKSSGEENAGGIAALGKMLVILKRIGLDLIQKEEQDLVRLALTSMSNIPDLTIHGIKNPDSREFLSKGGVISFHLPKILSDKIAKELALRRGICVRYGCHCAHILVKYVLNVSPSLEKFQKLMLSLIPAINLPGTVRVSFGIGNTKEDVVIFIEVLNKIIQVRRMQGDKFLSSNDYPKQNLSTRAIKKQMKDFTETVSQKVYS